MESRQKIPPPFIHKYLCTFASEQRHASAHKLFLFFKTFCREIQPLFSPTGSDFLAFRRISASIIDLPKNSSSSIQLPIIFTWFSRILLFLAELVFGAKMYHTAFRPDCVAIDFQWLVTDGLRGDWGILFFGYVPVTIFEWTFSPLTLDSASVSSQGQIT